MIDFTPSERRSLSIALSVLLLATVVRVLLEPVQPPRDVDRAREGGLATTAAAVDSAIAAAREAARPLASGERIDVNTADEIQLRRLPGVGRSRAEAILQDRSRNGPFTSLEDMERIPGVGPGLRQRWSALARVSPAVGKGSRRPGPPGIRLNRAQLNELEQITGIGPVIARRIVATRARTGPFGSYEDLLAVPGIGPAMLETLRLEAIVP